MRRAQSISQWTRSTTSQRNPHHGNRFQTSMHKHSVFRELLSNPWCLRQEGFHPEKQSSETLKRCLACGSTDLGIIFAQWAPHARDLRGCRCGRPSPVFGNALAMLRLSPSGGVLRGETEILQASPLHPAGHGFCSSLFAAEPGQSWMGHGSHGKFVAAWGILSAETKPWRVMD